jgi:hypothetical protein
VATIADLLARLERLATTLGPPDEANRLESHVAGWMPLAQQTLRAVSNLPTGGRPERVNAGLLAVLGPLARGPRRPIEARPIEHLSDLALTMGAISDVLVEHAGRNPGPEFVGREATKLEAGLLSAVHLTAGWSLGGLERQNLPGTRVSTKRLLRDLVALTEPWALIPPVNRGSILQDLRVRTNTAPGLEGAMVAWADETLLVLGERHRTTSWAMQAIAGNLALISHTAHNAIEQAIKNGGLPAATRPASEALESSVTAWRAAATWPPCLRLGGATTGLQVLTRDLQQHLREAPPRTIADTRNLLHLALPVAEAHVATMDRLVRTHDLWIHGPSLGPSAGYMPSWEREPWWSHQGLSMAKAAQLGHRTLSKAFVTLAVDIEQTPPKPLPLGWPPACSPPARRPPGERIPERHLAIGPDTTR